MDLTVIARTRSADRLVTELFEIIDGCRWPELASVFAAECVYDRPGYEPLVGLRSIERFYRNERIVGSGRHEVVHIVSDLGAAACWGRFTGVSRGGQPLDERFADTYQVAEGKIVRRQTYFYRPAI
jgi:ketosteroid isomerase-like protein